MNKSKSFIPLIIEATTKKEAVAILISIAEALHLSTNYDHLTTLKESMDVFKEEYLELWKKYKKLEVPRGYSELHEIRIDLGFLQTQLNDELAFEINKSKIYHEERKTEARAIAMDDLHSNSTFREKFNNGKQISASAARDLIGASDHYKEFITLYSMSYGLYQEFLKTMESIKMFNDSLASECRYAQEIEKADNK